MENNSTIEWHYSEGSRCIKDMDWATAIDHLRLVILLDPSWKQAYIDLANALDRAGRIEEALSVMRDLAQMAPENTFVHNRIGYLLYLLGRNEEARKELRLSDQLSPDDPDTLYNLALLANSVEDYPQAIELLCRALKSQPRDPDIHYHLGYYLELTGHLEDAVISYGQCLHYDRKNLRCLIRLGMVRRTQGREAEARSFWEQAIRLDNSKYIQLARELLNNQPPAKKSWFSRFNAK